MSASIISINNPQKIPEFPEIWDSTIRAAFANCSRKGYWEFIRNRRKPGGNIHQLFGGCFAKAMEVARRSFYERGLSVETSMIEAVIAATNMWEAGEGDELVPHKGGAANKTYAGLIDAIDSYFTRWPLDSDDIIPLRLPNGELFIEKTFAFPVDGTTHPRTGRSIVYAGRLDMLGVWKDTGFNIVIDEKTSTQLGDAWAASWPMRGQFSGYCKGSETYGYKIRHAIIRGIGILKSDITFAEDIQNRKQWQIDNWLIQIRKDINRAIDTYNKMYADQAKNGFDGRHLEDHWDQNFDSVCGSYGGCSYIGLCTSENPDRWLHNFDEVIWNPLRNRDE